MPVVTPSQPVLHKPKSKIRLRLGLTPPHPKPNPPPMMEMPKRIPLAATHLLNSSLSSRQVSITSTMSTSTNIPPSSQLNASTYTSSSTQSRADSRGAFAYDWMSPSPRKLGEIPAFDTISYATASSRSAAFTAGASRETLISLSEAEARTAYPTPSPSMSPNQSYADFNELDDPIIHHPHIYEAAMAAEDIFCLTDQQLSDRFNFITEIGYGNWGSVWECKPRRMRSSALQHPILRSIRLGRKAASVSGFGGGGSVAVKLVHRSESPTTTARVRALWGEMKIIRTLRQEPHPSIIQFEAFVISPSYALVIMPYLATLIPVCLPPDRAKPYFRQLASAIGYLHERGITHNDIKPANVLLSHNDVPVLVDFGFAQKWDLRGRNSFLSSISWGTPEYLDPQRAMGMPHDERASDVWSLGITLFEILIGRTPFEEDEQEEFTTPEELVIYYERTRRGDWIGEWEMPQDLEHLIRSMVQPDPAYRISAMQAYHHVALIPAALSVIITPHFIRAATSFDIRDEPMPRLVSDTADVKKEKKKRPKEENKEQARAATPTALGESIKQHTSMPRAKAATTQKDREVDAMPSPTKGGKLVIRQMRPDNMLTEPKGDEEDPTPTKITKPSQPLQSLRVKELTNTNKGGVLRTSESQLTDLSLSSLSINGRAHGIERDTTTSLRSNNTAKPAPISRDNRTSMLSSASTIPAQNKEEAMLKTMRSLEGIKAKKAMKERDVLGAIKRPAPSPPRPVSLDSAQEADAKKKKDEQRRSLGVEKSFEKLFRNKEEEPVRIMTPKKLFLAAPIDVSPRRPVPSPKENREATVGMGPSSNKGVGSPPRPRNATRPTQVINDIKPFPGITFGADSPLAELRERILRQDGEKLDHLRQISQELASAKKPTPASRIAKTSTPVAEFATLPPPRAIPRAQNIEALGIDSRLESLALWVKDMERAVDHARKALAEGRSLPLPLLALPEGISPAQAAMLIPSPPQLPMHQFGVTPPKEGAKTIPPHLRTSSTQVEPATPPKWMTYEEAEEHVADTNEWVGEGRKGKKDRPSVSHVLKLFSDEEEAPGAPSRTANTTEATLSVPLKPPALRGVPSTPALRSSTTRLSNAKPLVRKSESNLRAFAKFPAILSPAKSPRRVVYEDMLDSEPGVVRQGDGWSSFGSGRVMAKPSSMASLREKARALLGDGTGKEKREIVDLAKREDKRTSAATPAPGIGGRPATPGGMSVAKTEKKGIFGRLKGLVGGRT